jgi:hypothetical protein
MAQIDQGPATGNAVLVFGGTPVVGIEVHEPNGTNPNPPSASPTVDPQAGTFLFNVTGGGNNGAATPANAVNTTVNFGTLGTGIKFAIPA